MTKLDISHITFTQYLRLTKCIFNDGIKFKRTERAERKITLAEEPNFVIYPMDIKPVALEFDNKEDAIYVKMKYL